MANHFFCSSIRKLVWISNYPLESYEGPEQENPDNMKDSSLQIKQREGKLLKQLMRWGFISIAAKLNGATQHRTLLINHIHTHHQTFIIIFFSPPQLFSKGFQFQPVKHILGQTILCMVTLKQIYH